MASLNRVSSAVPAGALLALLAMVPLILGDFRAYQLGLFLLFGIAAQGVALAWGRVGFLPLGQSLYFGLGAYLSGHCLIRVAESPVWWLIWPVAVLVPAILAYATGRLVFYGKSESGPFFSLITLAMAMLGFQVALQWSSVTGGFNGLGNIPELPMLDRFGGMYWLIAAAAVSSTLVLGWLLNTPLGTLWQATAQNEARLQFFGYRTDRLKALAYAASAFLAAAAGALYAPHQGLVTPQAIGVVLATELVVWAAVGGRTSPYGALLGAVAIGFLSAELRERFIAWEALVALVFIVVVIRFPNGLWGYAIELTRRLQSSISAPTGNGDTPPVPTAVDAPALPGSNFSAGRGNSDTALSFSDVVVVAGGVGILNGLSLEFRTGEVHCIIGPNGAGKTSTFNALTGRLPVKKGTIRLFDEELRRFDPATLSRLGVGRKFQVPTVFPDLSVDLNLKIAVWACRSSRIDLLTRSSHAWSTPVLRLLKQRFQFLESEGARSAGELSQGQRQMLELAMALVPEPKVLLLDEPCAGLSPDETRQQIEVAIEVIKRLGATALVIEHDMAAVERMANSVHVLHQGRRLVSGPLAVIKENEEVKAVYTGGRK